MLLQYSTALCSRHPGLRSSGVPCWLSIWPLLRHCPLEGPLGVAVPSLSTAPHVGASPVPTPHPSCTQELVRNAYSQGTAALGFPAIVLHAVVREHSSTQWRVYSGPALSSPPALLSTYFSALTSLWATFHLSEPSSHGHSDHAVSLWPFYSSLPFQWTPPGGQDCILSTAFMHLRLATAVGDPDLFAE